MSLQERFESKYQAVPWSGCWIWTGSVATNNGYGRIGSGGSYGRGLLAHRVSYELHVGAIPHGMCVLHKCDVPSCVNPKHLFLGTQADNHKDMDLKGRRRPAKGEGSGVAKMKNAQVIEIRSDKRSFWMIGKDYGLSPSQVGNIKRGKHWRHL